MTRILAIDPGNYQSAYVVIDADTRRPLLHDKVDNAKLLDNVRLGPPCLGDVREADIVAIEMVASYGMPVGREVFDTIVWIGRFAEAIDRWNSEAPRLVYRSAVKVHHCHDSRAKDANITQALVDRFAPGQPNRGKGTKVEPGWFHGFAADIWQAYALAVYVADVEAGAA